MGLGATVQGIKEQIEAATGCPPRRQSLRHGTKLLHDPQGRGRTLAGWRVPAGARLRLHLAWGLLGGAKGRCSTVLVFGP